MTSVMFTHNAGADPGWGQWAGARDRCVCVCVCVCACEGTRHPGSNFTPDLLTRNECVRACECVFVCVCMSVVVWSLVVCVCVYVCVCVWSVCICTPLV